MHRQTAGHADGLTDDEGSFVFIVDKDNKVRRRGVTTGIVTPGGVAVLEGLNGSEKIILRAGGFVSEGIVVVPQFEGKGGS